MDDQQLAQKRFVGKVALITGSSRGIGKIIALRFAREGADIVLNYFRNRDSAEATAADAASRPKTAFQPHCSTTKPGRWASRV